MLLKSCGDILRGHRANQLFQKQPVSIQTFKDHQGKKTDFSHLRSSESRLVKRQRRRVLQSQILSKTWSTSSPPQMLAEKAGKHLEGSSPEKQQRTSRRSGLVRQPNHLSLRPEIRNTGWVSMVTIKAYLDSSAFIVKPPSPNEHFNDGRVIF